jgi:conjugative relaxase-like TrwC/TraI family protein
VSIDFHRLAPACIDYYNQWVLNVGKLARGRENYYLSAVARGAEDYYLGSGEAAGRWLGRGIRAVGLSGAVEAEELRAVLGGLHPKSLEQLPDRMHQRRLPGFDLTFRAPKSVSLLHALGNKDVGEAMTVAHEEAVSAALAYVRPAEPGEGRAESTTTPARASSPRASDTGPRAPGIPCSTPTCW